MADPQKILVIRYGSLGDLILTSGPIQNLRNSFPNAEIILTTKSQYKAIAELISPLIRSILLPDKGLFAFLRYAFSLRNEHFDLVLDLHNNLRSCVIRLICNFKKVIAYDSERRRRLSYLKSRAKSPPFKHTVDLYNDAIASVSSNTLCRLPKLDSSRIARRTTSPTIGIITSAKHSTKRWLPEYILELSKALLDQGLNLIVICDGVDFDIYKSLGTKANLLIECQPDLVELLNLISDCDIVICGDTGPMHIAEALSIPVIAIFGPTHPILGFYPLGERDEVASLFVECSPCSLHGEKPCFRDRRYCMEDLKPSFILDRVNRLLKQM